MTLRSNGGEFLAAVVEDNILAIAVATALLMALVLVTMLVLVLAMMASRLVHRAVFLMTFDTIDAHAEGGARRAASFGSVDGTTSGS